MNWRELDDPANIENRNAGNGGDLVKHTVYLSTLRFLLQHEPWSSGLRLRECHAGRGIYQIPIEDGRRKLLACLYATPAINHTVLLRDVQSKVLTALGCWPHSPGTLEWYGGSALVNAWILAESQPGVHAVDCYEWQPETRRILREVLADTQSPARLAVCIPPAEEHGQEFDGEALIERQMASWEKQDVVLLDPFAMWRQPADQSKRDRYGAIIDALIRRGVDVPSLILFWTWGRAFPVADGDLHGTSEPVKNGYQELRKKLHQAGFRFVLVRWRWGLQFGMWIVGPPQHLTALRDEIEMHCRLLSSHLIGQGCGESLRHPEIEVAID